MKSPHDVGDYKSEITQPLGGVRHACIANQMEGDLGPCNN